MLFKYLDLNSVTVSLHYLYVNFIGRSGSNSSVIYFMG